MIRRLGERWPWLWRPAAIYAASRLPLALVAVVADVSDPSRTMGDFPLQWDAAWYLHIASDGYPDHVPVDAAGHVVENPHGFFPLFPLLIRLLHGLGADREVAAVVLANLLAVGAASAVWVLARRLCRGDVGAADRSVALFAFFPSAFVLSMAYAEPLLVVAACVGLGLLLDQRWVAAGLAGAVASAARPNGMAMVAACAVAAGVAVARDREWRALAAPALAAGGIGSFMVFQWAHAGDPWAYVRSQSAGWGQGFSAGSALVRLGWRALRSPTADVNLTVSTLAVLVAVVAIALLLADRFPLVVVVYSVALLLPSLTSAVLVSIPRFVLSAPPLLIVVARRVSGVAFSVLLAVSAVALGVLAWAAWTTILLTP